MSLPSPPRHLIYVDVSIVSGGSLPIPTPTFPRPVINVSFAENVPSTKVQIDTAKDRSGSDNNNIEYSIVQDEGSDKFLLTLNRTASKTLLYLSNKVPLDREEMDRYVLNVSAQDDGIPVRIGYLKVNVLVLDANDNAPTFSSELYELNISESAPMNAFVFQMTASDVDSGPNGSVKYRLIDSYDGQFAIDSNSGDVTVAKSPLNCPSSCLISTNSMRAQTRSCSEFTCMISVEAFDSGQPQMSSRSYLAIYLLAENNHSPVTSFTNVQSNNTLFLSMNSLKDETVISIVKISDDDRGDNGRVTLSLTSGNELSVFRLDPSSISVMYLLKIANVDVERRAKKLIYNLNFLASDFGTPRRWS
ncbi:hypothetical protein HELRODRAFT_69413, partial [Helobdella robusta]|uniref:Cadherin domain-containing protein n=1 Tax=Helobdella robusta TaxID=6412 RepID=T1FZV0_HELRO